MTDLRLPGLRTRPLSSYLAALGLMRVVSEQADSTVRGRWAGQTFTLDTDLSIDELRAFLLHRYRPTPLVAPWNGADQGGFRPGTSGRASERLTWLETLDDDRLAPYRRVVTATRAVVATSSWQAANTAKDKAAMILPLRNALPDDAMPFLDAAVALTNDGIAYPPIFGTGGNNGRLELVLHYLEHLQRILDPGKGDRPDEWLAELLLGAEALGVKSSPGQFDYRSAGGPNLGRSGSGSERANPWTFVVSLEGALAFQATATRRLGSQKAQASAPFTVAPSAAGYSSAAAGESAKGEMWMPIWRRSWSVAELSFVLSEGRATWGDRQARNGTDFLRATRTLGVDRGVTGFERYAFLERHGQSTTAVAVGSIDVASSSDHDVRLTAELDGWISRLNRGGDDKVPGAIRSARNRVNRALFSTSERPSIDQLRSLLLAVAAAERAVSRSRSFQESTGIGPIPGLSQAWAERFRFHAEPELAVALLLASGHDRWDRSEGQRLLERSLRELLRPVTVDRFGGVDAFRPKGPVVPGLGSRPVVELLAEVLVLRARTGPAPPEGDDGPPFRGVRPQFPVHRADAVDARDPRLPGDLVERLAGGQLDTGRLSTWLEVLLLLAPADKSAPLEQQALPGHAVPCPLWRLLAPWFGQAPLPARHPSSDAHAVGGGTAARSLILSPVVRPSWPGRLRQAGESQLHDLAREIASGYAAAGLRPGFDPRAIAATVGPEGVPASVLAALLVPTRLRDLADLAITHLRIDKEHPNEQSPTHPQRPARAGHG